LPAFAEAVQAMIGDVRAEDGCLHYALLVDDTVPGCVNAIEMWRDEAALKVHLAQPWITEFLGKFGAKMQASTVQIYDVAGVRPLSL
jgi:quinol monooxygenase YgiN